MPRGKVNKVRKKVDLNQRLNKIEDKQMSQNKKLINFIIPLLYNTLLNHFLFFTLSRDKKTSAEEKKNIYFALLKNFKTINCLRPKSRQF